MVLYCDIMNPASCLLLSPRSMAISLPQGLNPSKPFLKSIPVPSTIVPSYSMDSNIINKPSCFTVGHIYLSVLSFIIIVYYHYFNDRLLTSVLLLILYIYILSLIHI